MPIITLTTDFGLKDYFVAAVKGEILKQCPTAQIVDISHQIAKHDIAEAAYVFKCAYKHFPQGTIHILSINVKSANRSKFLLLKHNGHYFIGPDNGVFSLMFKEETFAEIYEIELKQLSSLLFPAADVFAEVASQLANGMNASDLARPISFIVQKQKLKPTFDGSGIKGLVVHIDTYENIVSNIQKDLFEKVVQNKPFRVSIRSGEMDRIFSNYNDVPVGEQLCLFNSAGHLEIAMNRGKASSLLGIFKDDKVQIVF